MSKFTDKNKSLTKTDQESSQVAAQSHYAIYTTLSNAVKLEGFKNCELILTNFAVRKNKIAFAFPRHSPYLGVINSQLQSMFESGEIMKIIEKHSNSNPNCHQKKGKPLGFENIAIVFLLLVCGLVLSFLFCVMEWIAKRSTQ